MQKGRSQDAFKPTESSGSNPHLPEISWERPVEHSNDPHQRQRQPHRRPGGSGIRHDTTGTWLARRGRKRSHSPIMIVFWLNALSGARWPCVCLPGEYHRSVRNRRRSITVHPTRTRLARVIALALLLVVSLLHRVSPSWAHPPTQADPPTTAVKISPTDYLKIALDFIEQNALRRSQVDWPAIRTKAEKDATQSPTVAATYPIIIAVLNALDDHHSSFQPPPDASQLLSGKVNSYGFVASYPSRIVVSLSTGGPADKAGLKLRDRIDQLQGRRVVGVDGIVAVPKSKTGDFPKVLKLVVTRPASTVAGKNAPARKLSINIAYGETSLVDAPKADPVASQLLNDRVGYLELPGLVGTPADQATYSQQAHEAMKALNTSVRCGWIFDLRRNRGGYVYPMITAAGPVLVPPAGGIVGGKLDGQDRFERWTYADGSTRIIRWGETNPSEPVASVNQPFVPGVWDAPVAVLTSRLTASAAEAVTVAFRNRPNTRSFGEPTTGLTTNNVLRTMPDGALVIVTNATFADRTGQVYDGPITPDQPTTIDWSNIATPNDPVVKAAVAWLSTQTACQ
jgi:carboxyl-terminal processing protease